MTTSQSADDDALGEVFDSGRDRGGKSAPSEVKAPVEVATTPPEQPDTEQDQDAGKMVPLRELTGERKKLKGKLDEESRARIAAETEARIWKEQAERSRQPAQQAPQRQPEVPDPVTDHEGFARHVQGTTQHAVFQERLHRSEERARDKFGDDTVDEAFQAAIKAGLIAREHFIQTAPRHPWGALVEWHKQQKILDTVGGDPDKYRASIEEEVRQKVLAELKAGNGPGAVAQPTRFPGTLADSTASGNSGAHLSDEAALKDVFGTDRASRTRRKA